MTEEVQHARHPGWYRSGHRSDPGEHAHPRGRLRPGLGASLAIERDQAEGVGVVILDDVRAEPASLEPIDQLRQQHGARPVDVLERRQMKVDFNARDGGPLGLLDSAHYR